MWKNYPIIRGGFYYKRVILFSGKESEDFVQKK